MAQFRRKCRKIRLTPLALAQAYTPVAGVQEDEEVQQSCGVHVGPLLQSALPGAVQLTSQ